MLSIAVANQQDLLRVDVQRLQTAASRVLTDAGLTQAELSLAIVDDPTIHDLNRRFLNHDEATDVLSFLLERDGPRLEGEIVVSAETALRKAGELACRAEDELLLYVIHGALHLVGYDDREPNDRQVMRERESHYLQLFGTEPCGDSPART